MQAMDTYIGFDSAWTDNPKAPGAICAVHVEAKRPIRFESPQLASFNEALSFIRKVRSPNGVTLIAIDQPTLVPNATSMRPVERAAASFISWLGGGVQPANRARKGMFCDASPIWRFLAELGATEDPERARLATEGLYVMEVFPAIALASFHSGFCARLGAPRYNPARRKTFRPADWNRVALAAAQEARASGSPEIVEWCHAASRITPPRKSDQDKLDSILCALIALRWRLGSRDQSLLLGDLGTGYMVMPASEEVRARITAAARK
jgi:predicted RNase H-like nuclease